MLPGELVNVAIKMLRADLVKRALVGALQHGPKTLDSVRVRHPVHVLLSRKGNCLDNSPHGEFLRVSKD